MQRFAKIENGAAALVVEAHEAPELDGEWVLCGDASAGDVYDAPTGKFSRPVTLVAAASRLVSVGSFFDRFGADKWQLLADQNPLVQALVKDCSVRRFIDLDRPDLRQALQLLVSAGHAIDPEQILGAPIEPGELP